MGSVAAQDSSVAPEAASAAGILASKAFVLLLLGDHLGDLRRADYGCRACADILFESCELALHSDKNALVCEGSDREGEDWRMASHVRSVVNWESLGKNFFHVLKVFFVFFQTFDERLRVLARALRESFKASSDGSEVSEELGSSVLHGDSIGNAG